MSGVRRFLFLFCLVAMTGCGGGPTAPTVPFDQPFTLTVGERASFDGVRLSVEFTRVSGDSRCPADAVCIQGGDAIVHVRVITGTTGEYELHTGDSSRAAVTQGAFRIALVELQPYPFSSRTIAQDEYRATLTVSRQ
ncbi:MAG TPA: hypothetical protein VM846_00260 [Vicinamibacterales bacterium]|nr:hypothetical protein [Vicinamibacterales bacterium]